MLLHLCTEIFSPPYPRHIHTFHVLEVKDALFFKMKTQCQQPIYTQQPRASPAGLCPVPTHRRVYARNRWFLPLIRFYHCSINVIVLLLLSRDKPKTSHPQAQSSLSWGILYQIKSVSCPSLESPQIVNKPKNAHSLLLDSINVVDYVINFQLISHSH